MKTASTAAIHAAVAGHYEATLRAHGATARGVDWNDAPSHRTRHAQFLRLLLDDPDGTVLDVGCGYGDFLTFLRDHGHSGYYLGSDVAAGMIAEARRIHGENADHGWLLGAPPKRPMDYAIASGVLNVRRGANPEVWEAYVAAFLEALAMHGRLGFGFNMLSVCSNREARRADLHYADPVNMLRHCLARWGRNVALLQDYGLWEFTLLVRHATRPARPPSGTA